MFRNCEHSRKINKRKEDTLIEDTEYSLGTLYQENEFSILSFFSKQLLSHFCYILLYIDKNAFWDSNKSDQLRRIYMGHGIDLSTKDTQYLYDNFSWAWRIVAPEISTYQLQGMFIDLVQRYKEPHRFHHGLKHITEILRVIGDRVDVRALSIPQRSSVVLMTAYHDIIYTLGSTVSEELSALYFNALINELHVDDSSIADQVLGGIRASRNHFDRNDDLSVPQHIFLDADVFCLAGYPLPSNRYWVYVDDIEREAEIIGVSSSDFQTKRVAFLLYALSKKTVFYTEWFRKLNIFAQTNMSHELAKRERT